MKKLAKELETVTRPKQARSEQTLRRILDAAEALILDKGVADASIPEIVRRAGSSVGGFYARFKDKSELLRALEERFLLEMNERLEALVQPGRWSGVPLRSMVRPFVAELVQVGLERAPLIAAFLFQASREPVFVQNGLRFRRRVSERVSDLMLTRSDEIGHPEPEIAIDLSVQLAFGLVLQRVVFGEIRAGGRHLPDETLVSELTRAVNGYLRIADVAPDPFEELT